MARSRREIHDALFIATATFGFLDKLFQHHGEFVGGRTSGLPGSRKLRSLLQSLWLLHPTIRVRGHSSGRIGIHGARRRLKSSSWCARLLAAAPIAVPVAEAVGERRHAR
jgi:hypothetical protein